MRIRSFIRRRDWMTTLEWRLLLRHLRAFEGMIADRGTPVTPFLVHLLDQALTMRLLVTRVEAQLLALDEHGAPGLPDVDALARIFDLRERLDDAMSALFDALEGDDACLGGAFTGQPGDTPEPGGPESALEPGAAGPPPRVQLNRAARRAMKKLARAQRATPGESPLLSPPLPDDALAA